MVAALALMGPPFLILGVADAVPVVIGIVVLFVFGEMLWVPTLQTIAVDRAPAAQRGAYMGAFNATGGAAFALAPLLGLTVLSRFGDEAMWAVMAGLAGLGSLVFAVVLRKGHVTSNA
jgi:MFS family permease